MFVQRVVLPDSRHESWTVVGDDAVPIEPVERYLAFMTDVARSPNTVKAYAHDLKDWFNIEVKANGSSYTKAERIKDKYLLQHDGIETYVWRFTVPSYDYRRVWVPGRYADAVT